MASPLRLEIHAMNRLLFSTMDEISRLLRSKEISPVEVVTAHLQQIQEQQPKLNAFVQFDAESALKQAEKAESAIVRGETRGALHGIPLSIKSCIDVAGWPCPAGSLLRKEYVPNLDAPLVSRLKGAGAVLLGNTNTPEFLMAYETNNLVSGKTSNPWALTHSAGGSSGGEAAAIAAGCSMGGVGSDGGGSVRVPAHFCGIAGLKPTPGRVPATGHFPAGAGAISWIGVVGPMARTVGDVRRLFEVLSGPDPGDALSAPVTARKTEPEKLRGLRVGFLESEALGGRTPETQAAVEQAAELLSSVGFGVEKFQLEGLDRAIDLWWFFFGRVIGHLLKESIAGKEEYLSPIFREYLGVATLQPAASLNEFLEACARRDYLRADLIRQMQEVDILISPVSAGPAFLHGGGNYQSGTGYRDTMKYSQWLNLAGFPGLSVPLSQTQEGLPIGVQLIGKPFDEEMILAAGELLEAGRGRWKAPVDMNNQDGL